MWSQGQKPAAPDGTGLTDRGRGLVLGGQGCWGVTGSRVHRRGSCRAASTIAVVQDDVVLLACSRGVGNPDFCVKAL